jgi:L-ascorbate metabolism protein UlaG (beta-lactamase superfamily)
MLLIVSAAAAMTLAQAAAPPLEARFIGNMALAISDGQTTLFTDFPYQSGYSIYMKYDPGEIRSETADALSLITHRHGDHWDRTLFERTGWKVVGPEDAVGGLPPDRVLRSLPVVPRRSQITVGAMRIEALPTPHADIGHYSYLVTWHGRRLYFTGDTETSETLVATPDLDVAFVSPWALKHAASRGHRIDARRIVVYHHTAGEAVPACRDGCLVPTQGQRLTF